MIFRALTALIAVTLLSACTPPSVERGDGPVLVTVFVESSPSAAPRDGLFATYGIGVDQGAVLLDAQALSQLPARRIETDFPLGSTAHVFSGPRLSDILAASGAQGSSARLTAFDGYQVEISAEMISDHQPILATQQNGDPLPIGGLGPTILVWPRLSDTGLSDMNDTLWPWGVFAVEAIEMGLDED